MKKTIKNMIGSMTAKLAAILLAFGCAGSAWGAVDTSWYDAGQSAFTLTTEAQLRGLAQLVNAGNAFSGKTITLGEDIDVGSEEWVTIATNGDSTKFAGTFDGGNHTISNLFIDQSDETPAYRAAGFFGAINGTVKNLKFVNAKVTGVSLGRASDGATVNGIAVAVGSMAYGGTIDNVSVENATVRGNRYVAGIVGYAKGTVQNCTIKNVTIVAEPDKLTGDYDNGDKAGGIVGYCNGAVTIKNNTLEGDFSIRGYRDIGGIVGCGGSGTTLESNSVAAGATVSLTVDQVTGYYGSKAANAGELAGRVNGATGTAGATIEATNEISASATTSTETAVAVAQIGTTQYGSLDAATRAYESGDTIEIIGDASGMTAPEGWVINAGTPATLTVDPFTTYTKVVDGFYQNNTTYNNSTDFYITSKAGLEYFRDLVNGVTGVADVYASTYWNSSSTVAQWYSNNIFNGMTVHLMTDIDLGNEEWAPIGQPQNALNTKCYFYGHFNGENHTISNLKATQYTEATKTWYAGLFGMIGAPAGQTISNLTINNVTLIGYDYAGAIVGNAGSNPTAFNNCHVTGNIDIKCMMTGAFVGGIVGIGTSAITDCSVEGSAGSTIEGSTVGGLAGTSTRSANASANTVAGSTVTGVTVNSEDNGGQAGGLVGKATNPVTVTGNTVHGVTVSAENGKADALVGGVGGDVTASSNTTDTNVTVISKPEAKLGSEDSAGEGMSLAELAASWGAAYANEVITLGQDVALDKRIYFYKGVTIDLNGHKLTLQAEDSRGFYLDDGSIMVLKDSGTGGTFEHAYVGGIAIYVRTGSSLVFKNGIYNVGGNLTYNNGGTIAIESGVYTVGLSNVAIWTGSGTSTVSGGYFNVTRDTINWVVDGKLVEEVKEGQYAGYYLVRDIVDSDYVAENTTTGKRYLTLSDAMAEAKSGEVVQLIKTAVSGTLSFVPDGVVFNDNGFASTVISGAGTPSDPYLIKDIDLLKAFRNSVNAGSKFAGKYFKLTSDIDLNNEEWTPIGDYNKEFCGVFDGDNHTISNLRVTAGGRNAYGLFGRVMKEYEESSKPAGIVNVTINNATVKSPAHWAGALAGAMYTGLAVENCHLKGDIDISVSSDGGYYAGGLVGYGGYVAYVDCSVKGNEGSKISGALYVGGIVAWHAEDSGIIRNCSVEGVSLNGQTWVGGIAGLAHYGSTVAGCSVANINVAATDNGYAGQIVGLSLGKAGSLTTVVDNTVAAESVVVTAGGEEVAVQIGTENNPYAIVGWDVEKDTDGKVVGGTFERLATEALADGYILSEPNAQGLYTVEKEPVAKIGDTPYATLAEAIAAANSAADPVTITVLADCDTGDATISNPLKLTKAGTTLDLNGKTVTVNNNFSFGVCADDITVKNGNIESAENNAKTTKVNSYILVIGGIGASDEISGVTIEDVTMLGGLSVGGSSDAAIKGKATGTVLSDCDITSGDYYAVCSQNHSDVTIEGGTYTANTANGCTSSRVLQGCFIGDDGPEGSIVVTDGTFTGSIDTSNEGLVVLKGGTYNNDPTLFCSPDFVPETDSGLYTVVAKGVAKIERDGAAPQYFASFAAAIAAAQDGDTIQLLADCETGSAYTIGSPLVLSADNVTLDLNGKTLTTTSNFSFLISGDNDVVTNGTIQAGANTGKQTGINSYAIVVNGCDGVKLTGLTVNGGISIGGSTGETPNAAAATNVIIEDCTVTSGDFYAVCAQQNSTVTITSGTYTADTRSTYSGVIQGTFVGTDGPKGTVAVTGGTFTGKIVNNDEGDLVISGGSFSAPVLEKYCASGYIPAAQDPGTGMYTVKEGTYVAQIGTTKYETLAAAVADAAEGATVQLLADIAYGTDKEVEVWGKAVNLDLCGFTLTTMSEVSATAGNNGYKAAAVCYSIPAAGGVKKVTISNGTIVTAYGAGVYADDPGLELTLSNLTVRAATVGTQTTKEYSSAVRITGNAKVVIESGSYSGANAISVSNSGGRYVINGGEFTGDLFISSYQNTGVDQTVTITGGKFAGNFDNVGNGEFVISGGVFAREPAASYAATGCAVVSNTDPATSAAYPWTVAEVLSADIVYPTGESAGVPIPLAWATNYTHVVDDGAVVTTADLPAIVAALGENGANGIPLWQSYVLGLVPTDPTATLSLAAGPVAGSGNETKVSVTGLIDTSKFPQINGVEVKFRLASRNADGTWADIVSNSDTQTFTVSLESVAGKVLAIFADIATAQ